jgi:hypothetical protein
MHPDRLVAFATVALQHPDLAAQQLETGMKKYGLRGAGLGGSVEGLELSDPKFHPFWAKAEALGALVFIHPQGTAELERTGRRLICIKTEPYPSSLWRPGLLIRARRHPDVVERVVLAAERERVPREREAQDLDAFLEAREAIGHGHREHVEIGGLIADADAEDHATLGHDPA